MTVQLAETLREMIQRPEVMLSRVMIDRTRMQYEVTDEGGSVLLVLSAEEVRSVASLPTLLEQKLDDITCSVCSVLLLDGEPGICALCESAAVMGLLRLQ